MKLIIEAVYHYGRYVAQPNRDETFALFGALTAHEDHPQRALLAALRMQQELKRYSACTRTEGCLPIEVRVGIEAGEMVARASNPANDAPKMLPVGHSTGIAARCRCWHREFWQERRATTTC